MAHLIQPTGHDHAVVQHDARLHEQKNEQENHRQGHGGLLRRRRAALMSRSFSGRVSALIACSRRAAAARVAAGSR